jgi:hypothetical protein
MLTMKNGQLQKESNPIVIAIIPNLSGWQKPFKAL